MIASEIFDKTADFFEADAARWSNDVGYNDAGQTCFCLIGGVAEVAKRPIFEVETDLGGYLDRALGFEADQANIAIDWNDQEGRTVQEVVTLLRDAATLARGEGQ